MRVYGVESSLSFWLEKSMMEPVTRALRLANGAILSAPTVDCRVRANAMADRRQKSSDCGVWQQMPRPATTLTVAWDSHHKHTVPTLHCRG